MYRLHFVQCDGIVDSFLPLPCHFDNQHDLCKQRATSTATCVTALNVRSRDWLCWRDYGFSPYMQTLFHSKRFGAPTSLPFPALGLPLLAQRAVQYFQYRMSRDKSHNRRGDNFTMENRMKITIDERRDFLQIKFLPPFRLTRIFPLSVRFILQHDNEYHE